MPKRNGKSSNDLKNVKLKNNFFKNVVKSSKYAMTDLLKEEYVPDVFSRMDELKSATKYVTENFKNSDQAMRAIKGKVNSSQYSKLVSQGLRNIGEDLKSGKIYNKDRMSAIEDMNTDAIWDQEIGSTILNDDDDMWSTDGDDIFNLSTDDDKDFFNDDDDDLESGFEEDDEGKFDSANYVTKNVTKNKYVKNIDGRKSVKFNSYNISRDNSQLQFSLSKLSMENDNRNTDMISNLFMRHTAGTMSGVESINTNVGQLVSFSNDVINPFIDRTTQFYDENIESMRAINETLSQTFELVKTLGINEEESREAAKSEFEYVGLSNSSYNAEEYKNLLMNRLDEAITLKLGTDIESIKSMLGTNGSFELQKIASNPLGFLFRAGLNKTMNYKTKDNLSSINSLFQDLPFYLNEKLLDWKEKGTGLTGVLGKIFAAERGTEANYDLSKSNADLKKSKPFSVKDHEALTKVIPKYLELIVQNTGYLNPEGNKYKDGLNYNYNEGRFLSEKENRQLLLDELEERNRAQYISITNDFNKLNAEDYKRKIGYDKLSDQDKDVIDKRLEKIQDEDSSRISNFLNEMSLNKIPLSRDSFNALPTKNKAYFEGKYGKKNIKEFFQYLEVKKSASGKEYLEMKRLYDDSRDKNSRNSLELLEDVQNRGLDLSSEEIAKLDSSTKDYYVDSSRTNDYGANRNRMLYYEVLKNSKMANNPRLQTILLLDNEIKSLEKQLELAQSTKDKNEIKEKIGNLKRKKSKLEKSNDDETIGSTLTSLANDFLSYLFTGVQSNQTIENIDDYKRALNASGIDEKTYQSIMAEDKLRNQGGLFKLEDSRREAEEQLAELREQNEKDRINKIQESKELDKRRERSQSYAKDERKIRDKYKDKNTKKAQKEMQKEIDDLRNTPKYQDMFFKDELSQEEIDAYRKRRERAAALTEFKGRDVPPTEDEINEKIRTTYSSMDLGTLEALTSDMDVEGLRDISENEKSYNLWQKSVSEEQARLDRKLSAKDPKKKKRRTSDEIVNDFFYKFNGEENKKRNEFLEHKKSFIKKFAKNQPDIVKKIYEDTFGENLDNQVKKNGKLSEIFSRDQIEFLKIANKLNNENTAFKGQQFNKNIAARLFNNDSRLEQLYSREFEDSSLNEDLNLLVDDEEEFLYDEYGQEKYNWFKNAWKDTKKQVDKENKNLKKNVISELNNFSISYRSRRNTLDEDTQNNYNESLRLQNDYNYRTQNNLPVSREMISSNVENIIGYGPFTQEQDENNKRFAQQYNPDLIQNMAKGGFIRTKFKNLKNRVLTVVGDSKNGEYTGNEELLVPTKNGIRVLNHKDTLKAFGGKNPSDRRNTIKDVKLQHRAEGSPDGEEEQFTDKIGKILNIVLHPIKNILNGIKTIVTKITNIIADRIKNSEIWKEKISPWLNDVKTNITTKIVGIFGSKENTDKEESIKDILNTRIKDPLKDFANNLFGKKKDKNGEDKETFGSKFKKVFKDELGGKSSKIVADAGLGVLAGMFLPGGPIVGGLLGAGAGMVANSKTISEFIFGKGSEDPDTFKGKFNKTMTTIFKGNKEEGKKGGFKGLSNMKFEIGAGLIGSLFLPGGPIVGAALGVLGGHFWDNKADTINKFLFGNYDREKKIGKMGIIPRTFKQIEFTLLDPFAKWGIKSGKKLTKLLDLHLLLPLEEKMVWGKALLKEMKYNIVKRFSSGHLVQSVELFKNKLAKGFKTMGEKITSAFNTALKGVGLFVRTMLFGKKTEDGAGYTGGLLSGFANRRLLKKENRRQRLLEKGFVDVDKLQEIRSRKKTGQGAASKFLGEYLDKAENAINKRSDDIASDLDYDSRKLKYEIEYKDLMKQRRTDVFNQREAEWEDIVNEEKAKKQEEINAIKSKYMDENGKFLGKFREKQLNELRYKNEMETVLNLKDRREEFDADTNELLSKIVIKDEELKNKDPELYKFNGEKREDIQLQEIEVNNTTKIHNVLTDILDVLTGKASKEEIKARNEEIKKERESKKEEKPDVVSEVTTEIKAEENTKKPLKYRKGRNLNASKGTRRDEKYGISRKSGIDDADGKAGESYVDSMAQESAKEEAENERKQTNFLGIIANSFLGKKNKGVKGLNIFEMLGKGFKGMTNLFGKGLSAITGGAFKFTGGSVGKLAKNILKKITHRGEKYAWRAAEKLADDRNLTGDERDDFILERMVKWESNRKEKSLIGKSKKLAKNTLNNIIKPAKNILDKIKGKYTQEEYDSAWKGIEKLADENNLTGDERDSFILEKIVEWENTRSLKGKVKSIASKAKTKITSLKDSAKDALTNKLRSMKLAHEAKMQAMEEANMLKDMGVESAAKKASLLERLGIKKAAEISRETQTTAMNNLANTEEATARTAGTGLREGLKTAGTKAREALSMLWEKISTPVASLFKVIGGGISGAASALMGTGIGIPAAIALAAAGSAAIIGGVTMIAKKIKNSKNGKPDNSILKDVRDVQNKTDKDTEKANKKKAKEEEKERKRQEKAKKRAERKKKLKKVFSKGKDIVGEVGKTALALSPIGLAAGAASKVGNFLFGKKKKNNVNAEELNVDKKNIVKIGRLSDGEISAIYNGESKFMSNKLSEEAKAIVGSITQTNQLLAMGLNLLPETTENISVATSAGSKKKGFFAGLKDAIFGGSSDTTQNDTASGYGSGSSYYSQNDSSWANNSYAGSDMASQGCGPTALAMVTSDLTGKSVTPSQLANYATFGGYTAKQGTRYDFIDGASSAYGLSGSKTGALDPYSLASEVSNGPTILAGNSSDSGPFTQSGHYIVTDGFDSNGNIRVKDPRGRSYNKSYSPEELSAYTNSTWNYGSGKSKKSSDDDTPKTYTAAAAQKIPKTYTAAVAQGMASSTNNTTDADNLVKNAESQVGNTYSVNGVTPYGKWYGMPNDAWCAMFVSYLAEKMTNIPRDVIPHFASTSVGKEWFRQRNQLVSVESAKPGDIAFIDFKPTSGLDHTALVVGKSGSKTIETIEGNTDSGGGKRGVNRRKRTIGDTYVKDMYIGEPSFNNNGSSTYTGGSADGGTTGATGGASDSEPKGIFDLLGNFSTAVGNFFTGKGFTADTGSTSGATGGASVGTDGNQTFAATGGASAKKGETVNIPKGLGANNSYMGWSLIKSKSSDQYKLREKAGEAYDSNGYGKINGRYTIATTTTYGKVGDYLDIKREDGSTLNAIIADIKNQSDDGCNKWGHDYGKCITEFVVNTDKWYDKSSGTMAGNKILNKTDPGSHMSPVTSITNQGSFYGSGIGPNVRRFGSGTSPNVQVTREDPFKRTSDYIQSNISAYELTTNANNSINNVSFTEIVELLQEIAQNTGSTAVNTSKLAQEGINVVVNSITPENSSNDNSQNVVRLEDNKDVNIFTGSNSMNRLNDKNSSSSSLMNRIRQIASGM